MTSMLILTSLITAFAVFEVLAYRHGADSRPGFDERLDRVPRRDL
jgi:hypothetical protein